MMLNQQQRHRVAGGSSTSGSFPRCWIESPIYRFISSAPREISCLTYPPNDITATVSNDSVTMLTSLDVGCGAELPNSAGTKNRITNAVALCDIVTGAVMLIFS